MAVYNREQVGSSFKPYVLSTAVKQGMNVKTSTLDGYNNMCIPPDSDPNAYPVHHPGQLPRSAGTECTTTTRVRTGRTRRRWRWRRRSTPPTPTCGTWSAVPAAVNVIDMAQAFGVNTDAAGITGLGGMQDQAGIALGQASLTVGEQATMLATIDDNGIYHDAHVVTSITRNNVQTPSISPATRCSARTTRS